MRGFTIKEGRPGADEMIGARPEKHPGFVARLDIGRLPIDPPIPTDGHCAVIGCGREIPEVAIDNGDPFHSAQCARRFHGVLYPSETREGLHYDERRKRWVKEAA